MRKWIGIFLTALMATMLMIPSANATLICIGEGNEFADGNCDYTEINDALASSLADNPVQLAKVDAASGTSGGLTVGPSGGATSDDGVTWEYVGTEAPEVWVEKADGWYAVYSFTGSGTGTAADPWTDTGMSRNDAWIALCEAADPTGPPPFNCTAATSHTAVYNVNGDKPPNGVPEPATLGLLGLGLVGMGLTRRRKKV